MEMEQELFGQVMNDEELENELNALEADEAAMQIPDVPMTIIDVPEQ
jgi:hypothetical protein